MVDYCNNYKRIVLEESKCCYILDCESLLTEMSTFPIHYDKIIATSDPLTLSNLKELSMTRGSMSNSIGKYKKQKEYQALEDAYRWCSEYLSLLFNLVNKYQQTTLARRQKLTFKWTGFLAGDGKRVFELDDIRQELALGLVTYAAVLREMGYQKAMKAQLGDREMGNLVNTTKNLSEDIALAATMIRKAAGIYNYCSSKTVEIETEDSMERKSKSMIGILQTLKEEKSLPAARPGELSMSMIKALQFLCLADVQSLTAGKAETKTAAILLHAKNREGQILDTKIVSFMTIAALFKGACTLYDRASQVIKENTGEVNSVNTVLLDYIAICHQLAVARCYRCMGISKRIDKQTGESIKCLETGLRAIEFCKKVGGKNKKWRNVFSTEEQMLNEILQKVKSENNCVYFQKEPAVAPATPEEKILVKLIPYDPVILHQNLFLD